LLSVASRSRDDYDVAFYSPWMSHLLVPAAGPPPGGSETQIRALAAALAGRGLRVAIIVDAVAGLPTEVDGVTVIAQKRPHHRWPAPMRPAVRIALACCAMRHARAAVYVQRAAGTVTAFVALTAHLRGRRFIFSAANVTDFEWELLERRAWVRAVYGAGLKMADALVVQTDEQAKLCRNRLGRGSVVIRSIADAPRVDNIVAEAFTWIGRAEQAKNPGAFLRLAQALPDVQFRMVVAATTPAGATLLDHLQQEATAMPNLELLEGRPKAKLDEVYRSAVAIVSTSIGYEGMPNVLLEGWARGVPALALAHDPDGLIEAHKLGWVAAGDEERLQALARAAWSGRHNVDEIRGRCRDYVRDHHARDVVAGAWEALLRPGRRPVRVLQVLTQDDIGGTELMVVALTDRLDARRVVCEVALFGKPGPVGAALGARNVTTHRLGSGAESIVRLAVLLRRGRFDIVHSYGFKGPMLTRLLTGPLARGARCLVGVQSVLPAEAEVGSLKGWVTLVADRMTAPLVDRYEVNSRGAVTHLVRAGIPVEKLSYIPNAIDLTHWPAPNARAGRPGRLLVISCVGRFIPRKRQSDLVRAIAQLRERLPGFRLVLAGDGPSLEDVRALAAELDIAEFVVFTGQIGEGPLRQLLERTDIYAQPSLYEGMPASVLEAMASGLPVVGTRVNGIEDLVVDGETGLLVEAGDVDALADALGRLLEQPRMRSAMGRAARERIIRHFDLGPVAEAKTKLFLELAGASHGDG
jgi:glycosyltransferase involved in cell wall biosynthesis